MKSEILQKFNQRHLMIVGDVMLDRYLYGTVSRISPEAPVPVLDYENTDQRLGGAANVALNVLAMGGEVTLVGMTGNDEEGEIFRGLLRDASISDQWLWSNASRSTTLKTRVMARGQHLLRVDREDRNPPGEEMEEAVMQYIREAIREKNPEGIILQDYNKGLLTRMIVEKTIQLARSENIPVFVDPKKDLISSYDGCTVFKPNLYEASHILGRTIEINDLDLNKAADELQNRVDHSLTLITLSDKGLFLKRKGAPGIYVPSIPQEVADVCGAGDTVISTLAMCYLSGSNDESIAKISNIAGHIACRYPGVVPVRLKQLKSEIND